ncbi:MAG: hypothetical protein ACR2LT_06500, partial [Pyrinomonadaceae bacterium]
SQINHKHQNYAAQQRRGYERKARLMKMKENCCEICGYNRNSSALCFHHLIPAIKSFQIDIRRCSSASWNRLVKEADKCRLLYLNCHAEVHNPTFPLRFHAA